MPRTARIDRPGAFHHVYARGIEKRDIFSDEADRRELRRRLEFNLSRFDGTCLAWAFMPNHFHLLFHSPAGNLSTFMRCLMSGYAIYLNRKIGRVGHLFQNRYKSSPIDTERYLLELIRYIHLNPFRAGIVSNLEELGAFRWTGHWDIVRTGRFPWEGHAFVLDFFSNGQRDGGLDRYLGFLEDGMKNGTAVVFPDGKDRSDNPSPVSADFGPAPGISSDQHAVFKEIAGKTCREHGIAVARLLDGTRSRLLTEVRRKTLKTCVLDRGMPRKAVASWLGITDSGAAYLLREPTAKAARCERGC